MEIPPHFILLLARGLLITILTLYDAHKLLPLFVSFHPPSNTVNYGAGFLVFVRFPS